MNQQQNSGRSRRNFLKRTAAASLAFTAGVRGPTDWDGSAMTFSILVWPISFFTVARWGRVYVLTGTGSWSASFSFVSLQLKP